jgi:DNA invertase Pin-like site-specific DNA recombinase
VSRVGDRDGERFVSPSEQAERIRSVAERDGLRLLETIEELDVSGGTPLARRPGLRRAVEMVEAGDAQVVVVAFFDRLVRSLAVQAEVVERVEKAGGGILAVDVGEVRADTASRWLSSTMLGLVAEYHRRVTAERTAEAKRRSVERGVPPFPNIPPGYRQRDDGRLEPHPKHAPVVADAFRLRAGGATVMAVRDHLRANGIHRSFHGTQALLTSRVVLGELRFGELVNTDSHPAIIDPATWQRVQGMRSTRGRRPKSDFLLARLGVLRCGTCGGRMVAGSSRPGKTYRMYRCSPVGDCPRRVTVSADLAERVVVEAVQHALEGVSGTAGVEHGTEDAERDLERTERELDAAVAAFTGLEDVESARARLVALREERDHARERVDELRRALVPAVTVSAGDWHRLTIDEQRDLIRAVVDRAVVAPGRGVERVTVHLRGE